MRFRCRLYVFRMQPTLNAQNAIVHSRYTTDNMGAKLSKHRQNKSYTKYTDKNVMQIEQTSNEIQNTSKILSEMYKRGITLITVGIELDFRRKRAF